ncbi:MAG TPA: hypothetical protein VK993_14060 [Chthoniobacterales bacterium]|nr:hypothetical protein [Chthoniobacterales bacterium]
MPEQGIDLTLRLSLREGSVYYFTERSLTSPEPHYFIVVNSDPLTQQVLLLAVCSSKVPEVKQRRREWPDTVVQISPQQFDVLKRESIVDCNDLKQVSLRDFNARFIRKQIKHFGKDLPPDLRRRVRTAIHASQILPAEIKSLVAPP